MMPSLELFAERMRYWCEDADLGYDQTQRWQIYDGGESDCSSLVIHALQEAGFDTGSADYTGDLSANLTARGWVRLYPNIADARVGDILLNDVQHVAAVVSGYGWYARIAEAWLDEKNSIYYGQSGDQTGLETRVRGIYSYPWDCILRYEGEQEEEDMTPGELTNYTVPTVDEGEIPVWQEWAWTHKYAKESYYQLAALSAAVESLAAQKGGDPYDVVKAVDAAVKSRLDAAAAVEIDYDALGASVAAKMPSGADASAIAKATANELYKRLKA